MHKRWERTHEYAHKYKEQVRAGRCFVRRENIRCVVPAERAPPSVEGRNFVRGQGHAEPAEGIRLAAGWDLSRRADNTDDSDDALITSVLITIVITRARCKERKLRADNSIIYNCAKEQDEKEVRYAPHLWDFVR